ncbi:hypothetical protein GHI93_10270 [Lactococcus hircilactis]|uniref:Uncharacterized protein n=1 Tax=Lactococcus hircilactis TaxID=1494462 RepID=A0A7X1ZAJ5_9LACT|nr:hypothetical protein [Lactococcus hircilactis]MQW40309.1 hypothetical protein [Lactococcus hircilactis]
MLILFILFLLVFAVLRGFFKFILPLVIAIIALKLIFSSILLLFNLHFWMLLLSVGFFTWLIVTVSSQKRNY